MATSIFNATAVNASEKRQFAATLYTNGARWKVLPFDATQNGAKSDKSDTIHPVLRVQRMINGIATGAIENLFISSLYLDDETVDGEIIAHTGAINSIVKSCWDNPANSTDSLAVQAIIAAIYAAHPDGVITCSRQWAKDASGNLLKKINSFTGNLRPINLINWD